MATTHDARGLRGRITGRFSIDPERGCIPRFRAYAECTAWGVSTYTPGAPEGRFPLVVAMIETNDSVACQVPPQALGCGEEYLNPAALSPR
jgi:hypothetical protein